jgi:2-oxoglutarate ferredoxin oxidoreductase subunit alpha
MNNWMTKKFIYPDEPIDRGKVLWEKDIEDLQGKWGRYLDADGDGIPYRTLMGNLHPKAAYFARGTGHDPYAGYSEDPQVWKEMMDRLKKKYDNARKDLPQPVIREMENSVIGLISMGSADHAVIEAQDTLNQKGISTDYLRVRALPRSEVVDEFIKKYDRLFVIEMNRDGQLNQILSLASPGSAEKLISLALSDGLPLTAKWIVNGILGHQEGN